MSPKRFPSNVPTQARDIRAAWSQINMAMTFGDLDFTAFSAEIEKTDTLEAEVKKLRNLLIDRLNRRNDAYASLWDKVKRVRSGVKGNYGDDSSQYEMVGGTRASDTEAAHPPGVRIELNPLHHPNRIHREQAFHAHGRPVYCFSRLPFEPDRRLIVVLRDREIFSGRS